MRNEGPKIIIEFCTLVGLKRLQFEQGLMKSLQNVLSLEIPKEGLFRLNMNLVCDIPTCSMYFLFYLSTEASSLCSL